jgi:hypothetical protein
VSGECHWDDLNLSISAVGDDAPFGGKVSESLKDSLSFLENAVKCIKEYCHSAYIVMFRKSVQGEKSEVDFDVPHSSHQ